MRSTFPIKTALACLVLAALVSALAVGDDSQAPRDSAQQKLEEVRARMKKERAALSVVMKKQGNVFEKLKALKAQLKRSEDRLGDLEKERAIIAAENKDLELSTKDAQKKIREKQRYMGARLRARYKFGRKDLLRVWIEARSIADFSRRTKYLDTVYLADRKKIEEYNELMAGWKEAAKRLESRRKDLAEMEQVIKEQKRDLESERSSLENMLTAVNRERSAHEELLAELKKSENRLQGLIASLDRGDEGPSDFQSQRGLLCYPAAGPVLSGFGKKVHPQFNTVTMQKGIEIGAGAGAPVRAVFPGTVRFAQWFMGYGNLVILDHGAGYYTVYAHLSAISTSVGRQVSKGDVIGAVGDTGSLTGPSLYFEIRRHQEPMDPAGWLGSCVQN